MVKLLDRLPVYAQRRRFSDGVLQELRALLGPVFAGEDVMVTTTGSFARREACALSDLDFFVVCRPGDAARVTGRLNRIRPDMARIVPKPPAANGAFDKVETLDAMLANIGGQFDLNDKMTRRMLFLLEGEWLVNEPLFRDVRMQVLRRYVRETMSADRIAHFLLNDVIRYYRTISVDFEHKTTEAAKPWGTRYVKLVFPRKLLYFSGILAAAETRDLSVPEKLVRLCALFDLPVVERVHQVCGDNALSALEIYDSFLGTFERPEVRDALDRTTEGSRAGSALFNGLRDQAQFLTRRLHDLLCRTYPADHPIHLALFA